MDTMQDREAHETIQSMRDTAVTDVANLGRRIKELKREYEHDAWEETAKQIERLEVRLERRIREACALAVAATKFEAVPASIIEPGTTVRVVQTSHLDLLGRTGTVQLVTPSGNYEVRIGSETIIILGPEQVVRAH